MAVQEHPHLLWAWGGVACLLLAASAVTELFQYFRPSPETLRNQQRVRTWWLICLSLFVAMAFGRVGVGVLFCTVSILALTEFAALRSNGAVPRLARGAMCAVALIFYALLVWRPGWVPIWAVLTVWPVTAALGAFIATRSLRESLLDGFAFLFLVVGLGHVILLADLSAIADGEAGNGPGTLFFLLLLTALNDVGQYLWGKGLGGRKVVPRISPNKTLAGLIGGVLTTTFLSAGMAGTFTRMRWPVSAWAGLLLGLGGFLGDIAMSAYKRSVGAKDSGHLLPGHGGMLDRVDSLCVTAPLFYWFVSWV